MLLSVPSSNLCPGPLAVVRHLWVEHRSSISLRFLVQWQIGLQYLPLGKLASCVWCATPLTYPYDSMWPLHINARTLVVGVSHVVLVLPTEQPWLMLVFLDKEQPTTVGWSVELRITKLFFLIKIGFILELNVLHYIWVNEWFRINVYVINCYECVSFFFFLMLPENSIV